MAKPQRQYLTVQRTLGSGSSSLNRNAVLVDDGGGDGEPSSGHRGPFAALFKLDTWPRLRFEGVHRRTHACVPRTSTSTNSDSDSDSSRVRARAFRWSFENRNQIHLFERGADRVSGNASHCWSLSAWKRSRDFIGRLTIGGLTIRPRHGISGKLALS